MGTFNELRDISEYKPRLFTKPEGTTEIGCLRFSFKGRDYEYEIGPTHLRPFRLMRCLFSPSPRHVDTIAYCSVMQTQERVYAAIGPESSVPGTRARVSLGDEKVQALIRDVVKSLQRKRVGKHLVFAWDADRIRMEVVPNAPRLKSR